MGAVLEAVAIFSLRKKHHLHLSAEKSHL